MAITGKHMTAEELLQLPDDGMRHELIYGELTTMSPGGWQHGVVANRCGRSLGNHVEPRGLGQVCGAETGFVLARNPDLVRAPDAAFVRQERVAASGRVSGFWPGAPDLAVEVVSPSDRPAEVEEKVRTWLAHGTRLVIVVYPDEERARAHRPGPPPRDYHPGDTLDGGDVLPDWRLPLGELFA
jgi:Uma2 family endonuclease